MSTAPLAAPPAAPCVLLRQPGSGGWWLFSRPHELLQARAVDQVRPLLARVEEAVATGLWAVGFLSYEAAPAFDRALATREPGDLPLVWLGLFDAPRAFAGLPPSSATDCSLSQWQPSVGAGEYRRAIAAIHEAIARGDTYQVNYTLRLDAVFRGQPWALFRRLAEHPAPEAAYLDGGDFAICSASPELFFAVAGERIRARPMKGTAPRGRMPAEDERQTAWLAGSTKNRAENVMIVDMVRNDLGRIARPGSVCVRRLFEVEKYESLFQMTSTVEARTDAGLTEILAALFPCASVTGAPKVRTMELIARLEDRPRGVYTGAIGFWGPERTARFSVAIRTAVLDRRSGRAEYGTGGGIVWDSTADDEYRECRTKALTLTRPWPDFSLLETMRWEPAGGFFLLDRHLDRLAASAGYFGVPFDRGTAVRRLYDLGGALPPRAHRIRLLLDRRGGLRLESTQLGEGDARPWRLALARRPLDPADPFLFHKTTNRVVYDQALAEFPDHDDVLLWNQSGEVTESTRANLAARFGDRWLTPPVECGLLGGTLRAELLAEGHLEEEIITVERLRRADEVRLLNSLRGWIPAEIAGDRPAGLETPAPPVRSR